MPFPKLQIRQFKSVENDVFIFYRYWDNHNKNFEYQVYKLVRSSDAALALGASKTKNSRPSDLNTREMCNWVFENLKEDGTLIDLKSSISTQSKKDLKKSKKIQITLTVAEAASGRYVLNFSEKDKTLLHKKSTDKKINMLLNNNIFLLPNKGVFLSNNRYTHPEINKWINNKNFELNTKLIFEFLIGDSLLKFVRKFK